MIATKARTPRGRAEYLNLGGGHSCRAQAAGPGGGSTYPPGLGGQISDLSRDAEGAGGGRSIISCNIAFAARHLPTK